MSINGTLGSLAKYNDEEIILGKSAAYIKCKKINIDFLYYYLQLKEVQNQIWNIATGSMLSPHINWRGLIANNSGFSSYHFNTASKGDFLPMALSFRLKL
jgi:hypothetical protein